jgi:hypothetical protein
MFNHLWFWIGVAVINLVWGPTIPFPIPLEIIVSTIMGKRVVVIGMG